jgi:hypothetical protein
MKAREAYQIAMKVRHENIPDDVRELTKKVLEEIAFKAKGGGVLLEHFSFLQVPEDVAEAIIFKVKVNLDNEGYRVHTSQRAHTSQRGKYSIYCIEVYWGEVTDVHRPYKREIET